jgi:hypothetical protein
MKVGSGTAGRIPTSGIHWSMNIANDITYIAVDKQRQVIPIVKSRNKKTGIETEYISTEALELAGDVKSNPARKMDCIDCHNRPSHIYRPPVRIVDQSMAIGAIGRELPNIRTIALQALGETFQTTEEAVDSIPKVIVNYYKENIPQVLEDKKELVQAAIKELILQYSKNIFPEMKVSWKVYPNNIGHMTDLGCFRCHDGKHVSREGKVLTKDCNSCHVIMFQGTEPEPASLSVAGLTFEHPEDIGDAWKETVCKECHGSY